MVFSPFPVKNISVDPPLFLAPMAGVTHSAFRRLVSDFGGYGALFTEMLSGKAILHEKVGQTPFTKKRPEEGSVWYQLALSGAEDIPAIIDKLESLHIDAIDLNVGCPAPEMERVGAGVSLFEDMERFERVLKTLRSCWHGVLSVKCRLWKTEESWKPEFTKRIKLVEDCGIDALFVHPRYFGEKLKRLARWEHLEWISQQTVLPVIANGDIAGLSDIERITAQFPAVAGFMIGRQAVVKPWLFRDIFMQSQGLVPPAIDYAVVWKTYFDYVNEDFPPEKAIGRLKEFTKYYSANLFFGQQLKSAGQSATSLEMLHDRVMAFLNTNPRVTAKPSVSGI